MLRVSLVCSFLLLGVIQTSGCNDRPPGETILCYFDKDCPARLPKCVEGVCAGNGGGNKEGIGGDGSIGTDGPPVGRECKSGERRSCYTGPAGTANRGTCRAGEQLCVGGKWDPACDGEFVPEKEICDNLDNDCNGQIDEVGCTKCTPGQKQACYTGPPPTNGKGTCKPGTRVCLGTQQWGACEGQVLPSNEACDSKDNNCDGKVDEGCPGCKSGETRQCYTGTPGTAGKGICRFGKQTCNGGKWTGCQGQVIPQAEVCDKLDNDCNGKVDDGCKECSPGATRPCFPTGVKGCRLAGTTYACTGACKAGVNRCTPAGTWGHCEAFVAPRAEQCNGKDDDCDGKTDEDLSPPPCQDQLGACAGAVKACRGGKWANCTTVDYQKNNPKAKLGKETACDGVDNNCNGQTDEGCAAGCTPGQRRPCYSGHPSTQGKGLCKAGTQTCSSSRTWGGCVGQVLPTQEKCNGKDEDCDGYVDEAFPEQGKSCNTGRPGICVDGLYNCQGGALKCLSLYSPRTEICNGKDDDCNGKIDDGAATVTYYRDQDGDNFGDPNQPKQACLRPAGYVRDNRDCYDKNNMVYPGQPGFFVNHRGDGSFDYNCDGQQTKRFTKKGDCKNCQSPIIDIGFVNPSAVACGKPGPWVDTCRFDVGRCYPNTIQKYQECR